MREFFGWIERLASLDRRAHTSKSVSISQRYHRVAATSPLDFDDLVVRVQGTNLPVEVFSDLPGFLSVLCWADSSDVEQKDVMRDQQIASALGGLLTLALDRRVRVAATEIPISMTGSDIKHFLPTSVNDRELNGPLPDDPGERFHRLLEDVVGLPEAHQEAIGAAIDLHYAAALVHDLDLNAAYALVVAGLEALSRRYGDVATEWPEWEHAGRFDATFDELGLTDSQARALRTEILRDRHLRLRQGFASYVSTALPEDFWEGVLIDYVPTMQLQNSGEGGFTGTEQSSTVPLGQLVTQDRSILRRRLLAAYDVRSTYVHTGNRRLDTMTGIRAMIPMPVEGKEPLSFAGLRRILVALIRREIALHTEPRELPSLRLRH